MSERIKVTDAAKRMGISPQFIRIGLQQGILPFGYAIKTGKKKYSYYISPKLFTEHIGEMQKGE